MIDQEKINAWVVDDDELMITLLSYSLRDMGYKNVFSFAESINALASFKIIETKPDIMFLDINMPEIDGIQFLRELSEMHYEGAIVLISGEDDSILKITDKLARLRDLNVIGAYTKPMSKVQLEFLLNNFNRYLSRRHKLQQRQVKQYSPERIQEAIHKQEFINYYQPKVEVATGEVSGVETLVRWQHPEDGLVFPDAFIPIAERTGLINQITEIVAKQAITQIKTWLNEDLYLRVAINISMDDLSNVNFSDYIINLIDSQNVPHRNVILEVTESKLMANLTTALDVIARLQLNRIKLSVDDFGTGHSSLAQLRDLPFNQLKIDRGFTHGAHQEQRLKAIFDASNMLAKLLDMEVVAEGVEDIQDWRYLRKQQSDLAQGYFIARPMPPEAILPWIKTWNTRVKDELLAQMHDA